MSYYGPSSQSSTGSDRKGQSKSHRSRGGPSFSHAPPNYYQRSSASPTAARTQTEENDTSDLLSVQGYSCVLHCDDALAAYIDSEGHLELWRDDADADLWIDRFDARALLDVYGDFDFEHIQHATNHSRPNRDDDVDEGEGALLDEERYRDLAAAIRAKAASKRGTAAAGLSTADQVSGEGDMNQCSSSEAMNSAAINAVECSDPPSSFPIISECTSTLFERNIIFGGELLHLPAGLHVPTGVQVPRYKKEYDVLLFTAAKARRSGQLEVLLKLRAQESPIFDFLKHDHRYHSFYEYVKGLDESMFHCFLMCEAPGRDRACDSNNSSGDSSVKIDALSMLSTYDDDEENFNDLGNEIPILQSHSSVSGSANPLEEGLSSVSSTDERTFDSAYALIEALLNDPIDNGHDSDVIDNQKDESEVSSRQRERLEKARLLRDKYSSAVQAAAVSDNSSKAATHENLNNAEHASEEGRKNSNSCTADCAVNGAVAIDPALQRKLEKRSRSRDSDVRSRRRKSSSSSYSNKRLSYSNKRSRSRSRSPRLRNNAEKHRYRSEVHYSIDVISASFAHSYTCSDGTVVKLPFPLDSSRIRSKISNALNPDNYSRL